MKGFVTPSKHCYERRAFLYPIKHEYTNEYGTVYKYTCPVCTELGNENQVYLGQTNCLLCSVNLMWKGM